MGNLSCGIGLQLVDPSTFDPTIGALVGFATGYTKTGAFVGFTGIVVEQEMLLIASWFFTTLDQ